MPLYGEGGKGGNNILCIIKCNAEKKKRKKRKEQLKEKSM